MKPRASAGQREVGLEEEELLPRSTGEIKRGEESVRAYRKLSTQTRADQSWRREAVAAVMLTKSRKGGGEGGGGTG